MAILAWRAPGGGVSFRPFLISGGVVLAALATIALAVQLLGDPRAGAPKAVAAVRSAAGADGPLHAPIADVAVDPSLDLAPEDAAEAGAPIDPAMDPATDPATDSLVAALDARADRIDRARALPPAPIAGLHQPGPMGPLPVIAADGRTPFTAYRRPFTPEAEKPKIAVVVGGLGLNTRVTQMAIDELPGEITLSFIPYAENLQLWIDRARADGHEVLVETPMEPFDPEADDTGPQTLLAGAQPRENIARLENILSRAVGYYGVANYQGAKFAASGRAAAPIVRALNERGLAFIGNGISPRAGLGAEAVKQRLPFIVADRVLDLRREADAIDEQLLNLEALALERGQSLGAGFAYPVTVNQLALWARDVRQRGYQLAPASALLEPHAEPG